MLIGGLLLAVSLSPAILRAQGAAQRQSGVVARVMGRNITLAQLDAVEAGAPGVSMTEPQRSEQRRLRLEAAIWRALLEDYYRKHGVVATRAEVNAFSKALFKQRVARAEVRQIAAESVKHWKFDRALYKQYGGTVIFQQSNPFEPVGAYRKFLEEHERQGSFEILDPVLKAAFWEYYTGEHQFIVPPGEVNYDVPWWLQKPQK